MTRSKTSVIEIFKNERFRDYSHALIQPGDDHGVLDIKPQKIKQMVIGEIRKSG